MKKNNKGFTLAELLIVVAIIAVLVAIAIPIFTNQLEKSREATDVANIRSAYATLATKYLTENASGTINVPVNAKVSSWQTTPTPFLETMKDGAINKISLTAKKSGNYAVSINASGTVSVS